MKIQLAALFVLLTSCTFMVKKLSGFQNPRVETVQSIKNYFGETNNQIVTDVFFNNAKDSTEIMKIILRPFEGNINVYRNTGERICVNGTHSCSIYEFNDIKANNFSECTEAELNNSLTKDMNSLNALINKTSLLYKKGNQVSLNQKNLTERDFIYVYYWSKFLSGKKSAEKDFAFFKSKVESASKNPLIIRVNCDLREDWNLQKGEELNVEMQKDAKGVFEFIFGQIPFKQ